MYFTKFCNFNHQNTRQNVSNLSKVPIQKNRRNSKAEHSFLSSGTTISFVVANSTESEGSYGGRTSTDRTIISSKRIKYLFQPLVDDIGGGSNNGGKNYNGGGGNDGGDEDDYFDFNDGDDEESEGNVFFRRVFPDNYSKIAIQAILDEWLRTITSLPLWFRSLVELGLFSSQQLARFLTLDISPNFVRNIFRSLPVTFQQEFIGRLMADPAFIKKMITDQALCFVTATSFELFQRGDNFLTELDLVIANVMPTTLAYGLTMWSLAPSLSFNPSHKQMSMTLPNSIFEKSNKYKQYSMGSRGICALSKISQLFVIGAFAGASTSLLGTSAVANRHSQDPEFRPSVPTPNYSTSTLGLGIFMGFHADFRNQLINGIERFTFERVTYLPFHFAMTTLARAASHLISIGHQAGLMSLPMG
jgi:hypothetical protein